MNMTQLQYFKVLAEKQHYSQTAEELGIAQSSLSRSINALEDELGVNLFEKRGRNVQLTKYGASYYEYVKASLTSLELGTKKVKSMADPTIGEINIGLTFPLGSEIVPNILQRFSAGKENRGFSIRLFQNSTPELIGLIKNNLCDLVLCSSLPDEPEIQFTPLFFSHLIAVVPDRHPLAPKTKVTLEELAKYPFIMNSERAPALLRIFHQKGLYPTILSQVQGECTIVGLVSVNYGISIVDEAVDLSNKPVKALRIPELEQIPFSVNVAYMKNRWFSPAVKAFLNFLLKEIRESGV